MGERSAGAFWMVKSSVMMGLTPRAVDKLQCQLGFLLEGKYNWLTMKQPTQVRTHSRRVCSLVSFWFDAYSDERKLRCKPSVCAMWLATPTYIHA